jgi:atrial natriuretic peptide receptor A
LQVETVGDCYVIVSGVPHETPAHASEMAMIAVSLRRVVSRTQAASHMPVDYQLRMRIGMHSGTVAAGVIGMKAPRYCLFGDTVSVFLIFQTSRQP